jgi:hypothetical protein
MNLIIFISRLPGEDACKSRWKAYRDKQGVTYPDCDRKEHCCRKEGAMSANTRLSTGFESHMMHRVIIETVARV